MACPAVTGSAALVRQYFEDGFYPTGAANAPDGFNPSAALVKAAELILRSAKGFRSQESRMVLDTLKDVMKT